MPFKCDAADDSFSLVFSSFGTVLTEKNVCIERLLAIMDFETLPVPFSLRRRAEKKRFGFLGV